MTVQIGYVAAHEQFPASQLLDLTARAEQAGFDAMWTSDHFHPWQDNQGHAGHAWITLAALTQRTGRIVMGTGVTCPTYRNNPAIVAQAFATLANLAPGRIFLGLGTGEAINEVPTGGGWGNYRERADRLVESITIIRALWEQEWVSFEGKYHRLQQANLYDKPVQPVPMYVAAGGPKTGRLAGLHADGLITVGGISSASVIGAFEEGARAAGKDPAAMPRLIEFYAIAGDRQIALPGARLWQFGAAHEGIFDVSDPREVQRIAEEKATPEELVDRWTVSPDPAVHVQALVNLARQGYTHIFVHSPQTNQEYFIDFYGQEVLPELHRHLA
jgi:TAT-translocated FGD2 family F420-dependent dehydrogenase